MALSKKAFLYALRGGEKWDGGKLQMAGGAIGGLVIWYWGLKVPPEILDNPALSAVLAIGIGAICGALITFILRLCWWPFHWRLERHGGLWLFLRKKLGSQMWPVILMAAGFFSFVLLSGGGLIWFAIQSAHGNPIRETATLGPSPVQTAPHISEADRAQLDLMERTKALPVKDKENLSDKLRSLSDLFVQIEALRNDGQSLVSDYRTKINYGVIAKNVDTYEAKLKEISDTATEIHNKVLTYSRGQYFDRQFDFIFGGNPSETQLISSQADALREWLSHWSSIENRNLGIVESLAEPSMRQFSTSLDRVFTWMTGCRARLTLVKEQVV